METTFSSFSLLLLVLNILTHCSSTTISDFSSDQNALLAFKDFITSDTNGVVSKNWSGNTSICDWIGVSCSLKHRRVTALNLSGFELFGTIAPQLGNLTFLRSLDISSNNFTSSIPSELSKLHRLNVINVAANNLSGEIPSGILTNMSSLIEIDMGFNKLSGQLPSDICSGNTPKIRRIYLRENNFYGQIPAGIHKCSELEELSLSENQFTGNIPTEIGNLSMLTSLSLWSNNLQGNIPSSIFNNSLLKYLDLTNNSLSGSCIPTFINLPKLGKLYLGLNNLTGGIPKQVENLTLLVHLYVHSNKLTGELPEELGNLAYLEAFYASFNDLLNGPIPSSIFNISTLKQLGLQQNQFSGSLPPNMGLTLPNLEELYLFYNKLSGQIPSSISNASQLAIIELNRNSFTGSIPDLGSLSSLKVLRLWENNLTAEESPAQEMRFISSLTNCRDLEHLEISGNPQMNGVLPASIGNLSTSLVTFAASNCSIGGVIPSTIGDVSSLQALDLSENQLKEFIPTTIGKLKQLETLYLDGNQLQGYIPRDLCQLNKLGNLFLSSNMLIGPVLDCLGGVKSLRKLSLASNNLNSTLLPQFLLLPDLIILDLSSNNLSGQLPNEIGSLKHISKLNLSFNQFSGDFPSSIDGCESLEHLYLSNNMFSGFIPQSLGKVRGLTELDLSNNNLSGIIPNSFEMLKLELFNVSYNQLVGEIPDGGCFVNFTAQSFLHNSALCGATRFQVPPCAKSHRRSKTGLILKYIVPPFIAVIILVIIILFLIRRRKQKQTPPLAGVSSAWKIITEREITQGTSSFSEINLLGKGSFGSVFKAVLADDTIVAVKIFNLELEGALKSFATESQILGTIRHRNLVRILGCCSNTQFKALVLAYMPNGSLDKWLHSDRYGLDLEQRLSITLDVALALEYLHHEHTFTVVHCDIKPNNVLLDGDMNAHVGDFGISKLFRDGETAIHTLTMATIGYAAPEYGSEGKVSTSGDVYSYGILLLEIFTGMKPTDDMFSAEKSIKEWVGEALRENSVSEVVAPGLLSREDQHFPAKVQCVSSMFDLAMQCLAFSPEERLNMMQVVAAIQKIKSCSRNWSRR